MKRKILSITMIFAVVAILASCGGSSVEMTAEMTEFTGMIKGTAADVTTALDKFGSSDEIKTNDMTMYDLKDPKVTAKTGDCFSVEFSAGITTRMYDICWKEGKIVSVTDKGMK